MNCLLIESNPKDVRLIKEYVERTSFLQLEAVFESPMAAFQIIQDSTIDLIFLDIHTPEINGFDFIQMLNPKPLVIFTSTKKELAFEGFRFNAVDYLLKPLKFQDFFKAVAKAKKMFDLLSSSKRGWNSLKEPENEHLIIKANRKLYRVPFEDIIYIQGMKEYVALYRDNNTRLLFLKSLKSLESSLPFSRFIRIHRSYIIAIDRATMLEGNSVYLGKTKLPIGERYKSQISELVFS